MEQGAFIVSQSKEQIREIQFNTTEHSPSNEQLKLRDEVEKTLIVLQSIFKDDDKNYFLYFNQLLSLAQAGLVGPHAYPEVAKSALENFQNDIFTKVGGKIKNKYMKKLGIAVLIMMVISGAFAVISYLFYLPVTNYFVLWISCMPGVWLSFGARKTKIGFYNLHIIEEDRLEPFIKLIFAGLLTEIMGLIFILGIVKINLGGISTELINNDFRIIVLIGVLCGFSEQVLSEKVAKFASELFKN